MSPKGAQPLFLQVLPSHSPPSAGSGAGDPSQASPGFCD